MSFRENKRWNALRREHQFAERHSKARARDRASAKPEPLGAPCGVALAVSAERRLRELAERRGTTISALMREFIMDGLARTEVEEQA